MNVSSDRTYETSTRGFGVKPSIGPRSLVTPTGCACQRWMFLCNSRQNCCRDGVDQVCRVIGSCERFQPTVSIWGSRSGSRASCKSDIGVLVEPGFCPSFWFKNADMELPAHNQTRDQCCICERRCSSPAARRRAPVTHLH